MTNTPLKLTPLYTTAQRLGAQFVERQGPVLSGAEGWRVPETYARRDSR